MQVSRKLVPILLVVLVAAIALAACSGSGAAGQERTWFNLPSIPINVDANGSASFYGLGLGPVVAPATVQQLQAANAQELQVRAGADGIHVYVNGQDMPYVGWNQAQNQNLQSVLAAMPAAAPAASALPWLSRVGIGALLRIPPGQGQAAINVPRWTGPTAATAQTPSPAGKGLNLNIAFDKNGQGSIFGISADMLSKLAGSPVPLQLDPNTLQMINSLGWQKLNIKTTPSGIQLTANDNVELPGIGYDAQYMERVATMLVPLLAGDNPAMAALLKNLLPKLPGLNLDVNVSFNGEPGEAKAISLPVAIGKDGALSLSGLPIPGAAVPASLLDQLKSASISKLGVSAKPDSLLLSVNDKPLPKLSFTTDGLKMLGAVAGASAGMNPDALVGTIQAVTKAGLDTTLAVGDTGGGEAAPPAEPQLKPADLGDMKAPFMRLEAEIKDGKITSVGGLSADQLAGMGVTLPDLPPSALDAIKGTGAQELQIVNKPNELQVMADGKQIMSMHYDQATLDNAWSLAKANLAGSPLADAKLQQLIEKTVLPALPGTDFAVTLKVQ